MAELNLRVGLVGKLLVHYKLAKPDAVRSSNSCSGIATVDKYLKKNKASWFQHSRKGRPATFVAQFPFLQSHRSYWAITTSRKVLWQGR